VICVYGGIAIVTLVASYVLMQSMGIIGVGIAWVIGNGVVAGGIGIATMGEFKKHIFKFKD